LWLAGDGDQPQWRASLKDPLNGQQKGFDSLEELFDFLEKQVTGNTATPEPPQDTYPQ
jgi:hypothetical protein